MSIIGETIAEVFRHTFPKNLRFCRQCEILHAQLLSLNKRYKDKKYIPRGELVEIVEGYVPGPPPPFNIWGIRHLCGIRFINAMRCHRGYPSWLFTRAVSKEHAKLAAWFEINGTKRWIRRDLFVKEVLEEIHIAYRYQKYFLTGMFFLMLFVTFLVMAQFSETVLYVYLRYYKQKKRSEIIDFFDMAALQHCATEVSDAYKDKLVPTAFTRPKLTEKEKKAYQHQDDLREREKLIAKAKKEALGAKNVDEKNKEQQKPAEIEGTSVPVVDEPPYDPLHGVDPDDPSTVVCFNIVEMKHPEQAARVVFIPMPRVGTVEFYRHLGKVMQTCQVVLVEEAGLEALQYLPPGLFFPLKEGVSFPQLGLHHKFLDILNEDKPPPTLLPGNTKPPWFMKWFVGLTPVALKMLYLPNTFMGTKGDARIGWGRVKEAIENEHIVSIAVPWTPYQITNLRSSLYKAGWRETNVTAVEWIDPRGVGVNFCNYYNIRESQETELSRQSAKDRMFGGLSLPGSGGTVPLEAGSDVDADAPIDPYEAPHTWRRVAYNWMHELQVMWDDQVRLWSGMHQPSRATYEGRQIDKQRPLSVQKPEVLVERTRAGYHGTNDFSRDWDNS